MVRRWSVLPLCLCLAIPVAEARVKLTSLPARDRVEIHLDHPKQTLVEEERLVPLLAGTNEVDFAWANTQIDANSIVFRVIESQGNVNVLSVRYPPGENALVWTLSAEQSGSTRVRIAYLVHGLKREDAYRALANDDESHLRLERYLRIHNEARETFGSSRITLPGGLELKRPIHRDETREIQVSRYPEVAITKRYEAGLQTHGYDDQGKRQLTTKLFYELANTTKRGLGLRALPPGKVRIFKSNAQGEAFLGEDRAKYLAQTRGQRIQLGQARDLIVRRFIDHTEKQPIGGNVYNLKVRIRYEIENRKSETAHLDLSEDLKALMNEIGHHNQTGPFDYQILPASDLGQSVRDKQTSNGFVLRNEFPASKDGEAPTQTRHVHLLIRNLW